MKITSPRCPRNLFYIQPHQQNFQPLHQTADVYLTALRSSEDSSDWITGFSQNLETRFNISMTVSNSQPSRHDWTALKINVVLKIFSRFPWDPSTVQIICDVDDLIDQRCPDLTICLFTRSLVKHLVIFGFSSKKDKRSNIFLSLVQSI